MGTIIALGGGRYDDGEVMPIFERIVRESGKKNPHVVFLPTAGHDDTEGDEPIWESFEKLGCTVETLKLTDPANSREHIYNARKHGHCLRRRRKPRVHDEHIQGDRRGRGAQRSV